MNPYRIYTIRINSILTPKNAVSFYFTVREDLAAAGGGEMKYTGVRPRSLLRLELK